MKAEGNQKREIKAGGDNYAEAANLRVEGVTGRDLSSKEWVSKNTCMKRHGLGKSRNKTRGQISSDLGRNHGSFKPGS